MMKNDTRKYDTISKDEFYALKVKERLDLSVQTYAHDVLQNIRSLYSFDIVKLGKMM